ncbi:MAG: fibronectin type III domain-containing protein [Chloroflexi bacterium]|nr:fibronectin type III domain-containing protein [Chloroflexota bacterium]
MKWLVAQITLHKKRFFLGIFFFGLLGIVPVMVLGSHQLVEVVDSTAFCTSCHNVHYPEAVTFKESPHSEVSCAQCHVGEGPKNLVHSKLRGLQDIIPAITGNYEKPIPTPLKERRPSSETCEKCHWSEKFLGDTPRVKTTYGLDLANTKNIATTVLKVGGGKKEVASGIHWHSTATVWYLPLDDKRLKIGWVGTEDASGNVTQYIDPNLIAELTPERIQKEKRLMDCVDCHNRATHLFRSPDELVDLALADGSIDITLPFIKREAMKALVPQRDSLKQAYTEVEKIKEFYRISYLKVFQEKGASIDKAIVKLKEIAKLTTFSDGLDWNTYPDQAQHDKPGPDMEIDWDTISRADNSPGCFRCHGNLEKVDNGQKANLDEVINGFNVSKILDSISSRGSSLNGVSSNSTSTNRASSNTTSSNNNGLRTSSNSTSLNGLDIKGLTLKGGGPGEGKLDAECKTCHYSIKSPVVTPLAPATSHPIDGLEDCLVCHNPTAAKPFKADHPWSTNEACNSCHQSAPKLKAIPLSTLPPEAKLITHSINKLDKCLVCHGPSATSPLSSEHPWSTDDTCAACHKTAPTLKPIPTVAPPKAKDITHTTNGLEDCLACHSPASVKPFSQDHPWATNDTCAACHKAAPVPLPVPGAGAAGPLPSSNSPTGPAIKHSLSGLGACLSCHNQSGPGPFPAGHAGRPESFCMLCHKPASTPSTPPGSPPSSPPPPTTAPSAPSSLTATAASATQVNLGWVDNASNESGFRIERATNNTFTANLVTATVAANTASYSDITVAGSTTYYFRVFAYNSVGDSAGSNTASATTPAPTGNTPAAPTSLTATASSAIQVNLTWTDNANNENGFLVQRATNNTFTANLVTVTVAANAVNYSDTTVAGGTTYYYRVLATSSAGNSAASNAVSVTTPAPAIDAAQVYAARCTSCHGANRQGGAGPALTSTALASRTLAQVTSMVNHSGLLTTAEIPAVASWLKGVTITAPSAPTSLTATAPSAGQVNLSWVDNANNEDGFRIERATNNTFTANLVTATVAANAVSYNDITVTGSTTYYYRVFATNSAGNSSASNTASVTTPAPTANTPATPTAVAADAPSATQVILSWIDNANNESGFLIQRATNNTFTAGLTTATVAANAVSYNDTTVAGATTYYYRVFATNSAGNSPPSNICNVTTPTLIDPAASYSTYCASCHGANRQGTAAGPALTPTALSSRTLSQVTNAISNGVGSMPGYSSVLTSAEMSALAQYLKSTPVPAPSAPSSLTATAASATQVNLSWVDNANSEDGFRVERATNNTFTANRVTATVAANTVSYVATGLTGSTTYYFRVFATSSAGDSAASNTRSVTTPTATTNIPSAPTSLAATAASAAQVNLTWTDNANNESGFLIQRATNNTFTAGLTTATVAANAVSYNDTTVAGATTYYYRVYATNSAGNSAASNMASVTTPTPPVDATALYSTYCASCHGANRQGTAAGPALTPTALSSRTLSQVTSAIANGVGSMPGYSSTLTSAQISALAQYLKGVTITAPSAPSSLTATAPSVGQVNLSWVDNANNEDGFRIERATNNTFTANLVTATVGANTISYVATGLTGSTTYYFRVFAYNIAGNSSASNTASATTPAPTGSTPSAPTSLVATAASATQVNLTWVDNANSESGFLVQRATNLTFTANLITATLGANAVSYNDTTVSGGTTYYYRVYATNFAGSSAASNTASAITPSPAPTSPLIPHTTSGYSDCLACHSASGIRPFPANHAGRTNSTCTTCHQSSGSTAPPTLSVGAPRLGHNLDAQHQDCLSCHARDRDKPFPSNHTGYQNITCLVCHRTR